MDFERAWCGVLFWRYLAPDRGGRGDGYSAAVGSTTRHAQLRGLCAKGPSARPSLRESKRGAGRASRGKTRPRGDFLLGAPVSGKGPGGKELAGQWGVPFFSPGKLLREHVSNGPPLGLKAKP